MLIYVILLIVASLATYYFICSKYNNLPPGPLFHLPVLGHLPYLIDNPAKTLLQWSKIYGSILYVRLGSYKAVVIHDSSQIRKAFNLHSFTGRPHIKLLDEISGSRKGFVLTDGPKWTEQRKFMQRTFKNFGYGKMSIEAQILDRIPSLLDLLEKHILYPLNVKHTFSVHVLHVLWNIVAGASCDQENKSSELQQLAVNICEALKMSTVVEKLSFFLDLIPNCFPELSGFAKKVRGIEQVQNYLDILIRKHKQTRSANHPRDIIDAYLDEIEKTWDPQSAFFAPHNNITFALQEIFIAGVETTTTTLEWIFFYLSKYPNVQKKLQQQIDTNLETKRLPSSKCRQKLPYVEAVIQEVLRKSSITPMALFHSALEDTVFNGYTIPKDTVVVANLYGVHHDKDVWGDPEVFRPERFIDKNGDFIKSEYVLAFGSGKRSCIGEQLARLQLFLFTVCIFQRFNMDPVGSLPSEEGIFGFSTTVHPFKVRVSKRE